MGSRDETNTKTKQNSHLLDVNATPGKEVDQLRVLPAFLVPLAEAEVGVVAPRVDLRRVWDDKENDTITIPAVTSLPAAPALYCKAASGHFCPPHLILIKCCFD